MLMELGIPKVQATLVIGIPMMLLSVLLLSTTTGLYFLDITDEFVNKYGILGGALACIIATVWFVRKLPVLRDHLNRFSSFKVGRGWMALVGVASPLVLGYMLINDFIGKLGKPYENYPQHLLVIFGWGMVAFLIIGSIVISFLPWSHKSRAAEEPPAPPIIGGKLAHTHVDDAALKAHAKTQGEEA